MISDAQYFENVLCMTNLGVSKYFIAFQILHFHQKLIAIFQYARISLQINRIKKNLFICNLLQ